MAYDNDDFFTPKRFGAVIFGLVVLVAAVFLPFELWETVEANEIVIKQGVFDGKLEAWTQPGLYWQAFGKLTRYGKSGQFWFSVKKDEGSTEDQSLKIRFNDGGHGMLSGSIGYDLPLDNAHLVKLHSTFGSMDAVSQRLISQSIQKSVYMTGPLMSSKESAGERRADLINFISDQAVRGVYKTEVQDKEIPDILSGEIETVEVIDVPVLGDDGKPKLDDKGVPIMKKEPRTVKKPKTKTITAVIPKVGKDGQIEVQEASAISEFGVRLYNLTINTITYQKEVEDQIQAQQQATMAIQTAMAKAKEADQNRLTVEKQGEASAAKAKWDQEIKKAQAVTEAQQQKEVAALQLDTAKLQGSATVAKAQGEAEARKLVMAADGALDKKLAAYVEVSKAWAEVAGKQAMVPQVVMGGTNGGGTGTVNFMDLLGVKAARDLALDLGMQGHDQGKK